MTLPAHTRCVLRADGTTLDLDGPVSMAQIENLIGADVLDSIRLAGGLVMIVDDLGHPKGLPMNKPATLLYWEKCGGPVDWFIAGDVVIVPDSDFVRKNH